MNHPNCLAIRHSFIVILAVFCFFAHADELYRTDFEGFPLGDDKWVGTDGWVGNSKGVGVHGIQQDVIPEGGLGKTAFLGFNKPSATFVFTAKPINYQPESTDLQIVEVETLVGIQDSSVLNPNRDSFFVSVWNSTGNYLAGVRFSNDPSSYGIWRNDGSANEVDTQGVFVRGELHLLYMRIDLAHNRWSAELDGLELFSDATFNATAEDVDMGFLAYEWQLTSSTTANYGDNWMLVADLVVRSVGRGSEPFVISGFERSGGESIVTWPAENGFDYQVEYSSDALTWHSDLPGSSFPGITSDQSLEFTDPTADPLRLYRVLRTDTP